MHKSSHASAWTECLLCMKLSLLKGEIIKMFKMTTVVKNKTGIHARPASEFVQNSAKFSSSITIRRVGEETKANAKSIVFVLALGLHQGEEVEISAEGEDEEKAVKALIELIDSGFGE